MIEVRLYEKLDALYGKHVNECSKKEIYYGLLLLTKELMAQKEKLNGDKKVYYISSEFLIGKLLSNNLINLEVYSEISDILKRHDIDISEIEEVEPEPSLGNGGLGRLAACFLDSIATLGIPAEGISLLYHFGLFKQEYRNKIQFETPNNWIEDINWLTDCKKEYEINFGDRSVISQMFELDVVGYKNGVNKLKLFDIKSVNENIVNDGIDFDQTNIEENLTLFLYPDDSRKEGHLLRIYQQYFMVSSGAQMIIDQVKEKGFDLSKLYDHAIIQINDTHPTLVIPELIRLLQKEGLNFEQAVDVTIKTCAYTNHTILAEALEKWPLDYLEQVVPQLVDIIKRLDAIISSKYSEEKLQIIDNENRVHMAHICIHFSRSTNGVAALHTDILKTSELKIFSDIYPEKFNNKTNGITFRRWLLHANPELSEYLDELIGDSYKHIATDLEKLLDFKNDDLVLEKLAKIKFEKKNDLKNYLSKKENVEINPNSIYDIQVKRLHEYKRQQMNALYIIHKYLDIKKGHIPATTITFIFGAKAAPAYTIAKDIIHLFLTLQEIINNDPSVNEHIKLVFIENYNVSVAEKLFPACDVSEQISLASKEASGTGNMKFMLNGAITLGTMDGANVEIAELVGDDNIFIFGKKSEEIIKMYEDESYNSKAIYENNPHIKTLVDFIISDTVLKNGNEENLKRLHNEILNKDWFMTLVDINEYIETKEKCFAAYEDKRLWNQMSLVNTAKAGFFSSDRTINDYNRDIWNVDIK